VGQFILFSRISLVHASVEEIRQDVIRARHVWINTLSPVEQFSSNKNGRKYSN
jgi:hypothetical protein